MAAVALDLRTDRFDLPAPVVPAGITLAQALRERRSGRAFAPAPVPADLLSALLWAAFGINRAETGQRTAPSAHDWRETDLYLVMAEGSYRYDAPRHRLDLVCAEDLRGVAGTQAYVAQAPLNLVCVADFERMPGATDEERRFLAGADAGCIVQNVALFCAGAGLAAVVRGLIDRRALAHALRLRPAQRIALAQSVGWPAG